MASKKRTKQRIPNAYSVGPEHVYWPVKDAAGTVIALCPNMSTAQAVASALQASEDK